MSMLPVGIGSAAGGFQIERSLRFNSADSAYLSKAFAANSDVTQATLSFWHKRSVLATEQQFYAARDSTVNEINRFFVSNFQDKIYIRGYDSSANLDLNLITSAVYRDTSSWYSIIIVLDTTQATSSDRVKLYVNGERVTVFSSSTYPSLNQTFRLANSVNNSIGHTPGGSAYLNGYLAEYHFIDGQALTPSSFGETDTETGVWKPKKYTGTYGTNGFYLNFSDNSGTTSTTLGKDSSGNGNNWTPNNFSVTAGAGNDSLVDTPTPYGTDTGVGGEVRGNYATLNPLSNSYSGTTVLSITDGNLNFSDSTSSNRVAIGSMTSPSGKWYFEMTSSSTGTYSVGLMDKVSNAGSFYRNNGTYSSSFGGSGTSGYSSWGSGDVIGVAWDADAGKLWFAKNNTWQSGDPSAGTSPTNTFTAGLSLFADIYTDNSAGTKSGAFNFGQRPFAYTAPSGFKALCTQNLPEPTIKDGGDYFNTVLYTGNGTSISSTQSISGVGFQPDFVWIKDRTNGANNSWSHHLVDVVRGINSNGSAYLASNETSAETGANSGYGITSLNTDGFSLKGNGTLTNTNGDAYVAWNWKANGAGSSNTAGTITSTVSVNTTSGFSICTYTGTGSAATVGHGLGVKPGMVIIKNRSSSISDWSTWHQSLPNPTTQQVWLSATNAAQAQGSNSAFNNTQPTSSVFSVGTVTESNGNGNNLVAYCFAPVAGYSAFGSYTGNGSADGPMIFTNFRPAFILVKKSSSTGNWSILDASRSPSNDVDDFLYANLSDAELTNTSADVDFLSNGFKIRNTTSDHNTNGGTYIYAAFAESPFKYALAR